MLATPAARPPTGDGWRHEVKWDGMRLLADVRSGRLRLSARSGADATDRFPELAGLAHEYEDMLLDGEVVVLADGIPSFAALAERIHASGANARRLAARNPATYVIFDVLRVLGTDVTTRPWHERRALLEHLELNGDRWQVPPVHTDGAALLAAAREQGLEGVVSKRITADYQPGTRSPDWVKIPIRPLRSVVIGGWRPETGSESRLGSVLVAEPAPDHPSGWRYLGRVGSGLAGKAQAQVLELLAPLARTDCPFGVIGTDVPGMDAAGARWVEPRVVIDVRSLGLAGGGRLRQPSFHGVRSDLSPGDLGSETSAAETNGDQR